MSTIKYVSLVKLCSITVESNVGSTANDTEFVGFVTTTDVTDSFKEIYWNELLLISSSWTTSYGVKSAASTHSSTSCTGLIEEACNERACRVPVPFGASPTTSSRSSIRSAMLLALFQFVLSWKAIRYGFRNTKTPPMMLTTIANIMMTPRISLTPSSSLFRSRRCIVVPPLVS